MDEDQDFSYSAGQIEQLLKCAICLDRYNIPKILPCQHTFCSSPCLEGLVHPITRYIKCPECRAEHRVPYEGISGFPNNITIQGFLDLRSQRNLGRRNEQTGGATGNTEGVNRSNSTAEAAADAASAYINAVIDEQTPSVAAASRSGCTVCGREAFLSRCIHCDMIVCVSCQNAHVEQIKLDIARLTGQIRRGLPSISNAIGSIERKSAQIRQRTEAIKADISEAIERYIGELRNRQRLLFGEVEMFLQGETRSLTMHVENLEVEIASISSFCDTTDSSLARSQSNIPVEDLVDLRRQCVEYMEALRSYEDGNFQVPRERYLQFIVEENRLMNAITNYGEVVVSNIPPQDSDSNTASREESPQDAPASQSVPVVSPSQPVSVPATSSTVMTSSPSSISTSWAPSMEAVDRAIALIRSGGRVGPSTPSSGFSSTRSFTPELRPLPPTNNRTTPRRSLQDRRRHHMTDSRLAGLLGGSAPSVLQRASSQSRRQRSLTTGATLLDIQGASGFYQRPSQQAIEEEPAIVYANARSRTFERDESPDPGNPMSRVSSAEARLRSRPSVRFDINGSVNADSDSDEDQVVNLQVVSFEGNESTIVAEAMNNYQDKGRAIIRFGTRGNDEMQFTWPRGVAVSSRDDTILVADSSNHRVQVFDSVGRFIKTFGSYGQSEGEFDCLAGIAVNSFGQIITSDRYNHRIQVFDHNGAFQNVFGEEGVDDGQLLYPWGVACDKMGFIYICDKENHRVQVFQANGSFVRKIGGLGHRLGQLENPHYLAISPDNRIYVSDSSNHRIQVFSMYGDFLFSFGSPGTMQGQIKYPKGIAIDEQGFVVIADSGNNRIQVFHGDGRFYCMFGTYGSGNGQFKGLEGVAVLANGNVVVSDRENHRIQIF